MRSLILALVAACGVDSAPLPPDAPSVFATSLDGSFATVETTADLPSCAELGCPADQPLLCKTVNICACDPDHDGDAVLCTRP